MASGLRQMTMAERLWPRVVVDANFCWVWMGARARFGHGSMTIEGRRRSPHQIAWLLAHAVIPDGLQVLHRCDVPACINPDHLFLGTQADNMADMRSKGRGFIGDPGAGNRAKTHCAQGHPYDEKNTRLTKTGRVCRACHRERERRARRWLTQGK